MDRYWDTRRSGRLARHIPREDPRQADSIGRGWTRRFTASLSGFRSRSYTFNGEGTGTESNSGTRQNRICTHCKQRMERKR